jgi:hypothetical protein
VKVRDGAAPWISIAAPVICLIFNLCSRKFWGFDLGFSLLIVNGALSFLGMWLCRLPEQCNPQKVAVK